MKASRQQKLTILQNKKNKKLQLSKKVYDQQGGGGKVILGRGPFLWGGFFLGKLGPPPTCFFIVKTENQKVPVFAQFLTANLGELHIYLNLGELHIYLNFHLY